MKHLISIILTIIVSSSCLAGCEFRKNPYQSSMVEQKTEISHGIVTTGSSLQQTYSTSQIGNDGALK